MCYYSSCLLVIFYFHCQNCSDFQAGSALQSKSKFDALDETAVCGLCCKHGFPMKFLNLKGGER